MRQPTLSVVMSNYNHSRFIPTALEAILSQSYRPCELVVIDDGSTDDSIRVLEEFVKKEPTIVRVVRNERNMGLVYNTTRMPGLTIGDYIYLAACDDKVLPGFFEKSMLLLEQFPSAGLCSALSRIMDESGQDQGVVRMPIVRRSAGFLTPEEVLAALRRHRNWFMGNATVFRRSAFIDAGGFNPELASYCDGFISLVLALKHGTCFIPEPLVAWRRMETTYSRRLSNDLNATIAIGATAERLMRSTYHELFPADYVDEWRKDFCFGTATALVKSSTDRRFTGLERLIAPQNRADRAFLALLRGAPWLGRACARPYFFARFQRRYFWRTVLRRLWYVFHHPKLLGFPG